MKSRVSALISVGLSLASLALVQEPRPSSNPSQEPDEVIRRAVLNEQKLKVVEGDFNYRQDLIIQTFGEAKSVSAQLHRLSEVTYDDLGNRIDKIIEYPPSRLTMFLGLQKHDFKTLLGVDPFFLTPDSLSGYSVRFLEKKKVDDLNTYVFDIEPLAGKSAPKRKQGDAFPFKGRIWIDDQDLQIVKLEGKAMTTKDDNQRFPKFECYREYIEKNVWLPGYVLAEDTLDFPRYDLPIRMKITYSDYRRASRRK